MPGRRSRAEDTAGFGLVALVWGLNYLFVRVGLRFAPPLWLALFRAGVGALIVLGFLLVQGSWRTLERRDVRDGLAIGIPNTGLFFGLWFLAAASVPPGEAAVLVYTFPLWVTVLSGPVLHAAPGRWQWVAVTTGFLGVLLVSQPWLDGSGGLAPLPVVELLVGAASWALGTVLFKGRFTGPKIVPANAMQLAGGSLALLVLAPLTEGGFSPPASLELVGVVLWLGVLGTAAAYTIWFRLLDRWPAATLSGYTFLVPLVAFTASVAVFGESLSIVQACGVGAVLLAIVVNARGSVTRSKAAAE